ncbi:MAG: response regulator, partial [Bacteroidota bacterium]
MSKKPIIFLVDDDEAVLRSVVRDVRSEYRKSYRILSTTSANEALETVKELKQQNETIALFLSDQRMPEMLGVDFLEKTLTFFPEAKRVLLTAYSDTEAAIKAINTVSLDYYLLKPWNPPEEKLYPVLHDQLDEWQASFIPDFSGIRIIGYQWAPKSHQIKDFLAGNLIPYQWLDIQTDVESQSIISNHDLDEKKLPAIIYEDGTVQQDPSISAVGEKVGMNVQATQKMYDVAVIGAGPAGLAAGVYGGSEGLNTILIERRAPGGQAGTSSRIENYLGFPKGLSGADLSRRAITQATRFGIEFLSPQEVTNLEIKDNYKIITLKDGSVVNAKAIVITTGVDYRKHPAIGIDEFTGAGIYYGAATTEANACKNQEVYIV